MKPAIEGGRPVRKDFLVFGQPRMFQEEIAQVVETLRSGWWGTGAKAHEFEAEFAKYIGCKHAIALNSATAGLHLALDVLGVRSGDEVITTPLTFVSTVNVIVHRGARPVFADVDPATWNIDPAEIEKKITPKTKVVIPVHLHGRPCDMAAITAVAKKYRLYVVEDAAHATEAWYKGQKIGSISDFTAFSFYATKNLATGEGGMLTTNNQPWAEEARIKSLHGISKDAWKRYSSAGFTPYEAIYAGYKYNMPDLTASLGLPQLKRLEKNLAIRRRYWKLMDRALSDIEEIGLPPDEEAGTVHARHLYAILLRLDRLKIPRNQFINALQTEGIGAGIHFEPVHLHKFYREKYGFKKGQFPNAEYIGERTVSLPFYPHMSEQDVNDVIEAVRKIVEYYRK
ncbi:MAG: UDP-4-amino-4,6-dideoxy-N-acetyl-beta-L-altrosamine transaminase [Candidatus Chisholmbacteria bacterium RIFCSPHIGHO2_01_FULL_48_12]|uniref:UDP-4-amino-4, 6-dideoxy-N-acetyl-beta-L-altrosamine transaminase n=1 Tax=Candidatus Chisholmbacteria bacterium RIFCSPHIGHO2_01_FULL_48_12 TaxID=1797589 RepID=A0A1G1VU83_9BACT|nr:MAG: UDP-4-amino-4,6-dideoxy-N-acetyl-beta-L-altrosamine transaminase [Candidatus Chisholmbacteria bacterium RIFCSPHIGHO2_01_FULL_48_12]